MNYYMGIDGGGSNIRVVITDQNLNTIARIHGPTVNPSSIGRPESARRIQSAVSDTLAEAQLHTDQINACCIGVAGADALYAETWLRETLATVLPDCNVVPSSDIEIALVGAHAKQEGIIIIAGTGSASYGINQSGKYLRVGGWGFMVGDEGSGYWIGQQAIRHILRAYDCRNQPTILRDRVLNYLSLETELNLLTWVYATPEPRTRDIARIAPIVLECADDGDLTALEIIETAAQELAHMGHTLCKQLDLTHDLIAFAGSLIQNSNMLSRKLCQYLNLSTKPEPEYPPVMGAALLARLKFGA